MTLPDQMTDRWARRADPSPGQRTLYWHVLMRDYPQVGELASQARQRLARSGPAHDTARMAAHDHPRRGTSRPVHRPADTAHD